MTKVAAPSPAVGDTVISAGLLRIEPMASRQGFLDDLMTFSSNPPGRVAVLGAVGAFVGLHIVAVQTSSPVTGTTLASLGTLALHQWTHLAALFLQYLVPAGLLIGAVIRFIKQSKAKRLISGARANPKAISEMSWREFERLVGEGFRQRGYVVTGFGGSGPDGGIDLALMKDGKRYLVQCKHWRRDQVGVTVVRELNGVMAAASAHGGYVVTGGQFTREAQEFAGKARIELVDGDALQQLIDSVASTAPTLTGMVARQTAPARLAQPGRSTTTYDL